jgi:hypothetical protein
MKSMSIQGIIRAKPHRTAISNSSATGPTDKVNRQFRAPAPNMLLVSNCTYATTSRGFSYAAFVIDSCA